MKEKRDADRRDADRYRWARQKSMSDLFDLYMTLADDATPEEFDAAIDNAMLAGDGESGK